jgi:3-phosphoshikimate 1-carboxyvinyltransferase
MSFLIMGIASVKKIKINESNCIKTSFPDFVNLVNNLGAKIS